MWYGLVPERGRSGKKEDLEFEMVNVYATCYGHSGRKGIGLFLLKQNILTYLGNFEFYLFIMYLLGETNYETCLQ